MTAVDPRTVDVLLAARDAVGPNTWTQGVEHRDATGRFTTRQRAVKSCAAGHIAVAASHLDLDGLDLEARTLLACAIADVTPTSTADLLSFSTLVSHAGKWIPLIGEWNDADVRTWQDVREELDAAATLAKDMST